MPKNTAPILTVTFPSPISEMPPRALLGVLSDLAQASALLDGGVLHHEVLAKLGEVDAEILRRMEPTARVRCSSCGWTGGCQECSSSSLTPATVGSPDPSQLRLLAPEVEIPEVEATAEGCPGCGCLPGDGLTPGCDHPDGCGYMPQDLAPIPEVYGTPGEGKTVSSLDPWDLDQDPEVGRDPEEDREPPEATTGRKTLAWALRRLADYLDPDSEQRQALRSGISLLRTISEEAGDVPLWNDGGEGRETAKALRAAFAGMGAKPDYGPAGRALVIDRLEDDLDLYVLGGVEDDRVAQVAVVLHGIMGGKGPHEVLADQGLLDG